MADVAQRSQLILVGDDDDGIVYHSLPSQKTQKRKADRKAEGTKLFLLRFVIQQFVLKTDTLTKQSIL